MYEQKYYFCDVCGAKIDKETGETVYSKGSNAFNIEEIKNENKSLKNKVEMLEEKSNQMKGKSSNDEDNGYWDD